MIRIVFRLGAARSSRAIAWFSSGHLSHVDAKTPVGKLLGARSDDVGGASGVWARPDPYEDVTKLVIFDIDATPLQEALFYDFLNEQIGKPYDHLAILAFFINRDWRDGDAWYCSELIAAALEEATILTKTLFLPLNKITPVMLATLISQLPGAKRIL